MLPSVAHHPRFSRLVFRHADLEKVASGCRWAEGQDRSPLPHSAAWDCVAPRRRFCRAQAATSTIVLSASGRKGKSV
jgi:gluconolactonase